MPGVRVCLSTTISCFRSVWGESLECPPLVGTVRVDLTYGVTRASEGLRVPGPSDTPVQFNVESGCQKIYVQHSLPAAKGLKQLKMKSPFTWIQALTTKKVHMAIFHIWQMDNTQGQNLTFLLKTGSSLRPFEQHDFWGLLDGWCSLRLLHYPTEVTLNDIATKGLSYQGIALSFRILMGS